MLMAGLDIGTTGCKATVFDETGAVLGHAYRGYPAQRGLGGDEIDVAAIMASVLEALREITAKHPAIAALGLTSFGETFVLADGAGRPLHPAMLYTDPRGAGECAAIAEKIGPERVAALTGLRPHSMYSLPKMAWLKNHRPSVYGQAAHAFLIADYVAYRLTGRRCIEYSLAARTMAFDVTRLRWSAEMFAAAGLDMALMSEPVPTGTDIGPVTAEAAAATGLKRECHIVLCGHDQVAAAVGAGAFTPEVAVDGAGTVECLTPIFSSRPDEAAMYKGYFSVTPYLQPGAYAVYAFSYTGGALISWCVDTLAKKEAELAAGQNLSVNEYLERQYAGEGPTGLLALPHFAGAATPYMDTGSRGAVVGLTLATTAADVYRACQEGVAYEMRLNLEALGASAATIKRLHATGGGARSATWMQMKADVLNLPLVALETPDAGAVGSAMLTGVALGAFASLDEAAGLMVKKTRVYEPRAAMHMRYLAVYERYKKLYDAVRPLV